MSLLARATWAAERMIHAAGNAVKSTRSLSRPPTITITQHQPFPQSTWRVPEILDALENHEQGYFVDSARLAKAFGRDDRISACRNTRVRALVGRNGAPFSMNPSELGDGRRAGTVADRVKKQWNTTATEPVLTRIGQDVIDLGVSISRIHWGRVGTEWRPVGLEPWGMEYARWDHSSDCYQVQTLDQGEVEARPGTGEWLIVEPGGKHGYMSGGVRALSLPFSFRNNSWKDWARYCEKHGVPILSITEPPDVADTSGTSGKEAFFKRLRNIGREGILRLPRVDENNRYSAEFLEPKTLSWPAFEAFLKRLDLCIAVYLLGQNLSTEVSGGSLAAAISQNRVRLDYLSADAEALASAFREQVWMPWGRFNFDWWDDQICPWPNWATAAPEDLKSTGDTYAAVGLAMAKFRSSFQTVVVDEKALCEKFNIPILDDADAAVILAARAEAAAKISGQVKADPAKDTPPKEAP